MRITPFRKLLVANRGEIAARIFRSARAAGLATVAVYSDADADAVHVGLADEAVRIGGAAPKESYLHIDAIIGAAKAAGADAIHPGYGFLAENENLPEACERAGIVFVGPSARAIRAMGNKAQAKELMLAAGVPCVPGYQGEDQSVETLRAKADEIGYPVMIKAVAGGGGRGMRLVEAPADFTDALQSARSEAKGAFGDDTVLLERAIIEPRHIEIQILADRYGNAVHLGERDCSVQRRHQKVIEEAPSPAVSPALREEMGAASIRAVRSIGYEGAGTLEFLLSKDGSFWFMEMNTRLQVEHPVTEAITGLDLVALQLRVASGRQLPIRQEDVGFDGHAIEVRLCAEDPEADFMPQSGTLSLWSPPGTVRVEHALRTGSAVPPFYDSMIAKLIAHGPDREAARGALVHALGDTVALGIRTNQAFLAGCLSHPAFARGVATTAFVQTHLADLVPDRAEEERSAAVRLAAILRAGRDVAITHAFPASLRLRRGEVVHEIRVTAGRHGRCLVEHGDGTTELHVGQGDGDVCFLAEGGRSRRARLHRSGRHLWMQLDGAAWDFEDITFDPVMKAEAESDGRVRASMNGRVVAVAVSVGDRVARGERLLVLEAMKMEHTHVATVEGTVAAIHVSEGDQVEAHRVLVEVAAA